jgi:periplasmic copper chaperone A
MRTRYIVWAFGLFLITPFSHAQSVPMGNVTVEHPWARATTAGTDTGVVYMTIINNGPTSDVLVSVASPASRAAQVHENKVDAQGMTEMLALDRVEIPAHARIDLKPTARHVMLIGLKQPLTYKSTFLMTLIFEKAGVVKVTVSVEKAGAMTSDSMGGMKME